MKIKRITPKDYVSKMTRIMTEIFHNSDVIHSISGKEYG